MENSTECRKLYNTLLSLQKTMPKEQIAQNESSEAFASHATGTFKTFAHIADIDFSWFMDSASMLVPNMKNGDFCTDKNNNSIAIHFSQRNPADKLIGNNTDKLLIACYAWDGNAYPGNEYWAGMLTASGDPAAACCSLIGTVQNILINPWLKKNINQIYGSIQSGHHHKIKPKYKAKYRLNSFFKTAIVQKKN